MKGKLEMLMEGLSHTSDLSLEVAESYK
jgi:hypothetical protein